MSSESVKDIEYFLKDLDRVCWSAYQEGLSGPMLASTMLARVQHWYLMEDPSDLSGMIRLLEHSIRTLEDRPRFDT